MEEESNSDVRIIKRNGSIVTFDMNNITNDVSKIFKSTGESEDIDYDALRIAVNVINTLGIGYENSEMDDLDVENPKTENPKTENPKTENPKIEKLVTRDISTETIQDCIEIMLMSFMFYKTAKIYIINRYVRQKLGENRDSK